LALDNKRTMISRLLGAAGLKATTEILTLTSQGQHDAVEDVMTAWAVVGLGNERTRDSRRKGTPQVHVGRTRETLYRVFGARGRTMGCALGYLDTGNQLRQFGR
jgi:hypothetical protein